MRNEMKVDKKNIKITADPKPKSALNKKIMMNKKLAIKPMSIGGKATVKSIGAGDGKPMSIGKMAIGKTKPSVDKNPSEDAKTLKEETTNQGLTESERMRRLGILEKAGDFTDKLRKGAIDAEMKAKERTLERERKEQERKEIDTARTKREEEKGKLEKVVTNPETFKAGKPATEHKGVNKYKITSAEEKQQHKKSPSKKGEQMRRGKAKLTISDALTQTDENFSAPSGPSLASVRRRREKEKIKAREALLNIEKVVRQVVVPENITVADLAKRMSERQADVIKELMKLGIMATGGQPIDADTAEIIIGEFGHNFKRVAESDVEDVMSFTDDEEIEQDKIDRSPVVTIMGHVDHGKTSLLDAMRSADVAGVEAGGITQHIGAYSVSTSGGDITFLDTPGHEAFTEMRRRGASATDIVVIVVAGDDGIKPQTIEAINHSLAAKVPIIVAINKIDKAGSDPNKVQSELLEHGVQTEKFGGEVLSVEVSAKEKLNLDKLEEAILLQADILQLKASPKARVKGVIIEAKLERGRGAVATVLIQRGTLKIGQIFVAGNQWGRVRALLNDKGDNVKETCLSMPVEILGWNSAPLAGDDFAVVGSENKAREITEYRLRKQLQENSVLSATSGTVEDIFNKIKQGKIEELPIVIKADTQGSLEAIKGSIAKFDNEEVKAKIIHGATGGITETDITLANSTNGIIIGFNVRANAKARELAIKVNQEIRYYSIIYDLIDSVKGLLSGLLSPLVSEEHIGYATVKQVFKVSKLGNIAGCIITSGIVKRGAGVRILREDVVIYEGSLKQLKREKNDAKEVKQSFECGMMFEKYDDLKENDVIECFEIKSTARSL